MVSEIFVAGNSTVTNAGAIIIGPSVGPPAAGILAISDFNTIVNAAGATITTGDFGYGIFVNGNDAKVSNAGSVVTSDGPALAVQGDRAVITNSGTMTSGALGAGIVFTGTTATITNTISGNIIGGNDAAGIFVFGDSVTITNRGTITVGDGFLAVGIESNTFGGINNIINTGTINVGAGATGILVSGDGKVFNSGTINAPTGLAAIEFCLCSLNSFADAWSRQLDPGSRDRLRHRSVSARRHRQGHIQSQSDRRRTAVRRLCDLQQGRHLELDRDWNRRAGLECPGRDTDREREPSAAPSRAARGHAVGAMLCRQYQPPMAVHWRPEIPLAC
jgi:hypothetical protein